MHPISNLNYFFQPAINIDCEREDGDDEGPPALEVSTESSQIPQTAQSFPTASSLHLTFTYLPTIYYTVFILDGQELLVMPGRLEHCQGLLQHRKANSANSHSCQVLEGRQDWPEAVVVLPRVPERKKRRARSLGGDQPIKTSASSESINRVELCTHNLILVPTVTLVHCTWNITFS